VYLLHGARELSKYTSSVAFIHGGMRTKWLNGKLLLFGRFGSSILALCSPDRRHPFTTDNECNYYTGFQNIFRSRYYEAVTRVVRLGKKDAVWNGRVLQENEPRNEERGSTRINEERWMKISLVGFVFVATMLSPIGVYSYFRDIKFGKNSLNKDRMTIKIKHNDYRSICMSIR